MRHCLTPALVNAQRARLCINFRARSLTGKSWSGYRRSPPVNSSHAVIDNSVYLPSSLLKALRMPWQFWNSMYRMRCRLAYSTDCCLWFSQITVCHANSVCTGEALLTTHVSRGSLSFSFQVYTTHTKCMLTNCSLRLDSRELRLLVSLSARC